MSEGTVGAERNGRKNSGSIAECQKEQLERSGMAEGTVGA
jgi:hypothetical protein